MENYRNEAVRGKVTKAKGVHRRLDATSTRLNGSVHLREIDQRVARSVASKSMGTAGTAFRTFDSWKTDGQVFSPPPPPRIDTEGLAVFFGLEGGEILGKKKGRRKGK